MTWAQQKQRGASSKENARPRDPRLEQEPTDMDRHDEHSDNFGSNAVVSDDGGVNTHSHTPPPRQSHHTSKRTDWSRADKGQGWAPLIMCNNVRERVGFCRHCPSCDSTELYQSISYYPFPWPLSFCLQNNITEQNKQKLIEQKCSRPPSLTPLASVLAQVGPSRFFLSIEKGAGWDHSTLLGRLGVVILALLTGGSLVVPGRMCPQCRRAVETVLILQAIRPIELRVLQPRDQTLVLVTKLPSHQCGLSHHHHVLKGTARAGTYYPHNTGGCAEWLAARTRCNCSVFLPTV